MRSVAKTARVSINTVVKLLRDSGVLWVRFKLIHDQMGDWKSPVQGAPAFFKERSAVEIFDGTATIEPDRSVGDLPGIRQSPAQDPDALPVDSKHRFPVPGTGE